MKIKKIEQDGPLFKVTLVPNAVERFFGWKEKIQLYRDSGREYMVGSNTVYTKPNGNQTENGDSIGKAIDKFRRSY